MNNSKGITLIALVITIIVLLILAGVSIMMLTGENGILSKSTEAGEKTVIGEEIERIKLVANSRMIETENYMNGEIKYDGFKAEFEREYREVIKKDIEGSDDDSILDGKTLVSSLEKLIFTESYAAEEGHDYKYAIITYKTDRVYYLVLKGENVGKIYSSGTIVAGPEGGPTPTPSDPDWDPEDGTDDPDPGTVDPNAGTYTPITVPDDTDPSISVATDPNDTTIDKYSIQYIEDLVQLSKNVSEGHTYEGKTIVMTRNLDFTTEESYRNPSTTAYDSYLTGDGTTTLIEQLSNTGKGFMPIGSSTDSTVNPFKGTFNGNSYKLKNIYINAERTTSGRYAALFGYTSNATIQHLKLIRGVVEAHLNTAGFVAHSDGSLTLSHCRNKLERTGKDYGSSYLGGLVAQATGDTTIEYSSNKSEIHGTTNAGSGLIGETVRGNIIINKSYNKGEIVSCSTGGGLRR